MCLSARELGVRSTCPPLFIKFAVRRSTGHLSTMGKGGRGSASEATADDEFFVHIHGKKIDCRKWSRSHPGGSKALRIFKDRDATEQFDMCAASDRSNPRAFALLVCLTLHGARELGTYLAHTTPAGTTHRRL